MGGVHFLFGGRGGCGNEVGWSALMGSRKAGCGPDCCKSMSGLESGLGFTSSGSGVTEGSRSLIRLEFWTNGGGSVVGIGDFCR